MIALVVRYEIQDGQMERLVPLLRQMGEQVRQHEPDCLMWQASRSLEHPNVIRLHEVYRDQAALDFHRQTPHFQELVVGQIRPLTSSREADVCEVLAE